MNSVFWDGKSSESLCIVIMEKHNAILTELYPARANNRVLHVTLQRGVFFRVLGHSLTTKMRQYSNISDNNRRLKGHLYIITGHWVSWVAYKCQLIYTILHTLLQRLCPLCWLYGLFIVVAIVLWNSRVFIPHNDVIACRIHRKKYCSFRTCGPTGRIRHFAKLQIWNFAWTFSILWGLKSPFNIIENREK